MTISLLSFIREALKASIAIVETSPIKNFIKGRAAFYYMILQGGFFLCSYCSKFAPELQHKYTKKSSKINHANLYKKARQSPVLVLRDYFNVFFRICKQGNSEYYRKVFVNFSVSLVIPLHFALRARSRGNIFRL